MIFASPRAGANLGTAVASAALVIAISFPVVSLVVSPTVRAQGNTPRPPQTPTFSTTVEYVEVDARVVDDKGNPVRNLKKDDFHLLEDGKEQTIETFSAVDIPIESSSTTTSTTSSTTKRVEPDVSANSRGPDQSRVFVFVLDDRQIDAARTFNTIKIVTTFITRNMGANDLAAIVLTSGRTDISQTLTGNKTLLLKAANNFMGRKLEPRSIAGFNGVVGDLGWDFEGVSAYRTVRDVATWMADMRGRTKVMLFVSEGFATPDDPLANPNAQMILDEERLTLSAATRGNVTINTIDPRGLYAFEELTSIGGPQGAPSGTRSADNAVGAEMSRLARTFRGEVDREHMSMRLIADETGGLAAVNTNNFQATLDRIVVDHSTYYLLGYYPVNTRRDGKTRAITVRVNGRGMKVTARRSWREASSSAPATPPPVPGPAGTSTALREALNNQTPMDGVPLAATAAAFRGADGKASIAVIVETPPAANIALTEQNGRFVGGVDMTTVAIDARNAVAASATGRIDFQMSRESADRLKQQGFRALTKLDALGPGRYQVRAAIAMPGSPQPGSVWYDLDVPDFSKGDLTLSSLVVSSLQAGAMPTGNSAKLFDGIFMAPPTAGRQFRPDDELTVFAEVYANRTPVPAAKVTVAVKDERGRVVFQRDDAVSAAAFVGDTHAYRSLSVIPLVDLSPGAYVLSLEAVRVNDDQPVVRAIPFRVVP